MSRTLPSVRSPRVEAARPSEKPVRRMKAVGKPPGSKACHHVAAADVVQLLGVDAQAGLSGDDVARRLKEFGPNRVTARRGPPEWLKFLRQFHQPLVYVLLLASGVTA